MIGVYGVKLTYLHVLLVLVALRSSGTHVPKVFLYWYSVPSTPLVGEQNTA